MNPAEENLRHQIALIDEKLEAVKRTKAVFSELANPDAQDADSKPVINNESKAAAAYKILGEVVDEYLTDLVFEAHREAKLNAAVCQICSTKCRNYASAPSLDIFGNSPSETDQYPCANCGKMQTSTRYAIHLEKCMGISTRGGPGRAARQRTAANQGSYSTTAKRNGRSVSPYTGSSLDERDGASTVGDSDDDRDWSSTSGQKRKKGAKLVNGKAKKMKVGDSVKKDNRVDTPQRSAASSPSSASNTTSSGKRRRSASPAPASNHSKAVFRPSSLGREVLADDTGLANSEELQT